MSLTKAEIVGRIADQLECVKREAEDYFESVLTIMKETLESGEKLKIAGFGSFVVKQKSARRGRNPQTGEKITIEARTVVTFKPSTILRAVINGEEGQ